MPNSAFGRFRFLPSYYGPHVLARHAGDRDATLLEVIHERTTSFSADPNAGLGIGIALRGIVELGAAAELRTDGRLLRLAGDRMVVADEINTVGTTWTVRIPMMDRSAVAAAAVIA